MSALLRVERIGPGRLFARVTLTRPEVRNALNPGLIAELRAAFVALAAEPPQSLRGVVLAGEGKSFSAGADVKAMREAVELGLEANEADAAGLRQMLEAIDACPVPVVVRVHGAALGGGMGLCAVGDVVVATTDAIFGFTETRLGILPAVIGPFVLAKIGETHARAVFPTGQRFDAERAQRMGLVHEIVADEVALEARIEELLGELAAAGPTAARAAKALVRELRGLSPADAATLTVRRTAERRTSPEGQEGLRAFLEKRPPRWTS